MKILQKWPVQMLQGALKCLVQEPQKLRFYSAWARTLVSGRSPLADEIPWIVYEAIDWLSPHLEPKMHVFEWGSGGSTLFFASRVRLVTSVEHDAEWYQIVRRKLLDNRINNVDLRLVKPETHAEVPSLFMSTSNQYRDMSFQRYVEMISAYSENTFDLVMIDGRARSACFQYALTRIRSGGYLLLDNADREAYKSVKTLVSNWRSFEFHGPVPYSKILCATAIWQRP